MFSISIFLYYIGMKTGNLPIALTQPILYFHITMVVCTNGITFPTTYLLPILIKPTNSVGKKVSEVLWCFCYQDILHLINYLSFEQIFWAFWNSLVSEITSANDFYSSCFSVYMYYDQTCLQKNVLIYLFCVQCITFKHTQLHPLVHYDQYLLVNTFSSINSRSLKYI